MIRCGVCGKMLETKDEYREHDKICYKGGYPFTVTGTTGNYLEVAELDLDKYTKTPSREYMEEHWLGIKKDIEVTPIEPQSVDPVALYNSLKKRPRVPHYDSTTIQPLDVIDEWSKYWGDDTWYCGNIIKYIRRYQAKDGVKDLKKAQDYLTMLIRKYEDE